MADVAGFAARKAEAAKRGKLRGLGYASYIEACGIAPSNVAGALGARAGLFEAGEVRVHPTGSVTVFTGSHSHGQGHETTFAQVVAARLGIADRQRRRRARRYRPRAVRHGHLRLALARGRRHGDRQGARQDRRQGQEDRRAPARGRGGGHRVQGRQVHGGGHRPQQDVRARSRSTAYVPHNYPLDKLEPGLERDRVLRSDQLHLPGRHAHLRGRDRSRDRRHARSSASPRATTSATSSTR